MNKKDVACSELALLLEADAKALISISKEKVRCLKFIESEYKGVIARGVNSFDELKKNYERTAKGFDDAIYICIDAIKYCIEAQKYFIANSVSDSEKICLPVKSENTVGVV